MSFEVGVSVFIFLTVCVCISFEWVNKAIAAVEDENDALAGVLKNNIDFNAVKGKTKIPNEKWKDLTPGLTLTERLTLFLADYAPTDRLSDGGGHAHEGEDIEVLELPLDDARRLARDGGIVDAKTMLLLMYLERERGLPPL